MDGESALPEATAGQARPTALPWGDSRMFTYDLRQALRTLLARPSLSLAVLRRR